MGTDTANDASLFCNKVFNKPLKNSIQPIIVAKKNAVMIQCSFVSRRFFDWIEKTENMKTGNPGKIKELR